jgi:hypothetical protein
MRRRHVRVRIDANSLGIGVARGHAHWYLRPLPTVVISWRRRIYWY